MISTFHKNYREKAIATSLTPNSALPMIGLIVKQKQTHVRDRPAKFAKQAKKTRLWIF